MHKSIFQEKVFWSKFEKNFELGKNEILEKFFDMSQSLHKDVFEDVKNNFGIKISISLLLWWSTS